MLLRSEETKENGSQEHGERRGQGRCGVGHAQDRVPRDVLRGDGIHRVERVLLVNVVGVVEQDRVGVVDSALDNVRLDAVGGQRVIPPECSGDAIDCTAASGL
jgi:hypothetical protein